MKLTIVLDHRYSKTPDGNVWTRTGPSLVFWKSYLKFFKSLDILARIDPVDQKSDQDKISNSSEVNFLSIPYYRGPVEFILKSKAIYGKVKKIVDGNSAIILRIPSTLGTVVYQALRVTGQPYAVQVLGDPYEVFSPGAVRHPLRPLFRWWFTRQLKLQCRHATAVSYVTRASLQKRYPGKGQFSNSFSDVELSDDSFVPEERAYHDGLGTVENPCRLVLVGSLAQLYKSPDIAIQSVALCFARNIHFHLTIVGDGKHRAELEKLAHTLSVTHLVKFTGQLSSGEAVRTILDQSDIFVLPSRTEGLPRAMIEAMARALPCIGSTVGGIPELLSSEYLVPPGDVQALAQKLQDVISSPQNMEKMSRQNLKTAHTYSDKVLENEKQAFYNYIIAETTHWQMHRKNVNQTVNKQT